MKKIEKNQLKKLKKLIIEYNSEINEITNELKDMVEDFFKGILGDANE